jgi:glutaconyl-CoA decarboxylase
MPAHNRTDGAAERAPAGRKPAERASDGRASDGRASDGRAADHTALARLADSLVPALVSRLGAGSLGEIEIREDDWIVRVRRSAVGAGRRASDRPRHTVIPGHTGPHAPAAPAAPGAAAAPAATAEPVGVTGAPHRAPALSPAVGVFRSGLALGARVRAGDRIAVVDLLGIAQDVVAPIDGTLVEVHPQAGDGVEYGEVVAMIESAAPKPARAADGEG